MRPNFTADVWFLADRWRPERFILFLLFYFFQLHGYFYACWQYLKQEEGVKRQMIRYHVFQ